MRRSKRSPTQRNNSPTAHVCPCLWTFFFCHTVLKVPERKIKKRRRSAPFQMGHLPIRTVAAGHVAPQAHYTITGFSARVTRCVGAARVAGPPADCWRVVGVVQASQSTPMAMWRLKTQLESHNGKGHDGTTWWKRRGIRGHRVRQRRLRYRTPPPFITAPPLGRLRGGAVIKAQRAFWLYT